MLADNGIKYFEIEMLLNWFVTDERRTAADESARRCSVPPRRSEPGT